MEHEVTLRRNSTGTFGLDLEWDAQGFVVMGDYPEQKLRAGDCIVSIMDEDLRQLPEHDAKALFERYISEPCVNVTIYPVENEMILRKDCGTGQMGRTPETDMDIVVSDAREMEDTVKIRQQMVESSEWEEGLIVEVARWLSILELAHYRDKVNSWIDENGAAMLEEVAENAQEVVDFCSMKPLEGKRFLKWASDDMWTGKVCWEQGWTAVTLEHPDAAQEWGTPNGQCAIIDFNDLQPCRWVRLNVNYSGSAGMKLCWSYRYGFLVEEIFTDPGQSIQVGEMIVAIHDKPLRYLPEETMSSTFFGEFDDGVSVLVYSPPATSTVATQKIVGRRIRSSRARATGYDADKMWSANQERDQPQGPRSGAGARLAQHDRRSQLTQPIDTRSRFDTRSRLIRKAAQVRMQGDRDFSYGTHASASYDATQYQSTTKIPWGPSTKSYAQENQAAKQASSSHSPFYYAQENQASAQASSSQSPFYYAQENEGSEQRGSANVESRPRRNWPLAIEFETRAKKEKGKPRRGRSRY